MDINITTKDFLHQYPESVIQNAIKTRAIILETLPDIQEQLDIPARMIAFVYGQRYVDMICTLIPSKKGLKLGFYKGVDLPDPENLLEGTGKISRYIDIKKLEDIKEEAIKTLLEEAYKAYLIRMGK